MRVTSIVAGFGLLLTGAYGLDKPLDIQIEKAVECSRKTVAGSKTHSQNLLYSH